MSGRMHEVSTSISKMARSTYEDINRLIAMLNDGFERAAVEDPLPKKLQRSVDKILFV